MSLEFSCFYGYLFQVINYGLRFVLVSDPERDMIRSWTYNIFCNCYKDIKARLQGITEGIGNLKILAFYLGKIWR